MEDILCKKEKFDALYRCLIFTGLMGFGCILTLLAWGDIILPIWLTSSFLIAVSAVVLVSRAPNSLLFLTKTVTVLYSLPLVVPGLLLLFPSAQYYSFHSLNYQTTQINAVVVHLGLVGLVVFAAIVLSSSIYYMEIKPTESTHRQRTPLPFYALLLLSVVFGKLGAPGGSIFSLAYYSPERPPVVGGIGVFSLAAVLTVLWATFEYLRSRSRKGLIPLVVTYLLVVGYFLLGSGNRVEVGASLVGAAYLIRKYARITIKRWQWSLLVALAVVGATIYGNYRSVAATGETFLSTAVSTFRSISGTLQARGILFVPTLGDIILTFSATVGLVSDNLLRIDLGRTYLEYIPRTLPEILYPDRPIDMSRRIVELTSIGGGSFVLSEAFVSFGRVGPLMAMAVVGLLTAYAERAWTRHQDTKNFLYVTAIALSFRGLWYGGIAFYKGFLIAMAILVGVGCLTQLGGELEEIARTNRRKRRSSSPLSDSQERSEVSL